MVVVGHDDAVAVAVHPAGFHHFAVGGGLDGGAFGIADIQPGMVAQEAVARFVAPGEGVQADAEARTEVAGGWRDGWRMVPAVDDGIHPGLDDLGLGAGAVQIRTQLPEFLGSGGFGALGGQGQDVGLGGLGVDDPEQVRHLPAQGLDFAVQGLGLVQAFPELLLLGIGVALKLREAHDLLGGPEAVAGADHRQRPDGGHGPHQPEHGPAGQGPPERPMGENEHDREEPFGIRTAQAQATTS